MKPRPDCETCKGDGWILVPGALCECGDDNCSLSYEKASCPECDEINELENEQIKP